MSTDPTSSASRSGEGSRDRPIIMSSPVVRAILREIAEPGTGKTQTRRIAKLYPSASGKRFSVYPPEELIELEPGEFARGICHYASTGGLSGPYKLPYAVGDRLWVRETWQLHGRASDVCTIVYRSSINDGWTCAHEQFPDALAATMRPKPFQEGWRSAAQMRRWASRLTLLVTDVRVERLQDITEADAVAEGLKAETCCGQRMWDPGPPHGHFADPRVAFRMMWSDHHAPGDWAQNPWVAAITFRPILANIDTTHPERRAAERDRRVGL